MDGKALIKTQEYEFLWNDSRLGDNLILLTFGGSYSYGTNIETSDIDIRGCTLNRPSDLIGLTQFEQMVHDTTDTVVYAFNKLIQLLLNCNPNTIEMLGCKPEHYLYLTDIGRDLLANRTLFLSQKAVYSFGGYATQQLRRLENALAHDAYEGEQKEQHIMNACNRAMDTFPVRYRAFQPEQIRLYLQEVDDSPEIYADVHMSGIPIRNFSGMLNELIQITRDYDKLNHRNKKKDDAHLNKHAMHLVRLYFVCLDILEKGDIITYREQERELLLSIRNGAFQKPDHTYRTEFFELISELEQRMDYAQKNTCLPEKPDIKRIEEFVMEVNRRVILHDT